MLFLSFLLLGVNSVLLSIFLSLDFSVEFSFLLSHPFFLVTFLLSESVGLILFKLGNLGLFYLHSFPSFGDLSTSFLLGLLDLLLSRLLGLLNFLVSFGFLLCPLFCRLRSINLLLIGHIVCHLLSVIDNLKFGFLDLFIDVFNMDGVIEILEHGCQVGINLVADLQSFGNLLDLWDLTLELVKKVTNLSEIGFVAVLFFLLTSLLLNIIF